jgi:Phosphatidylinositolglycan class N (PIG-N)
MNSSCAEHISQIFKFLAPFVFLSVAFATLNAHLGMPPFALFLVSLSLTDDTPLLIRLEICQLYTPTCLLLMMMITFFFNVTDTGEEKDYDTLQRALTLILQVLGWGSASRYPVLASLHCSSCFP